MLQYLGLAQEHEREGAPHVAYVQRLVIAIQDKDFVMHRSLDFGIWNLDFGIWNLEFGIWVQNLELGNRPLFPIPSAPKKKRGRMHTHTDPFNAPCAVRIIESTQAGGQLR